MKKITGVLSILLTTILVPSCKEAGTTDAGPEYGLKTPENLAAVRAGQTAVRITWTDTSLNEEGFEVERKTNNGAFAGRIYTASDLAVAVDSAGLAIDSTYTYRVRAIRYDARGPYSGEAAITLTP